MKNNKVLFKRFSSKARKPEKASSHSAGYDLFSAMNIVIEPHSTLSVATDIGFSFLKKLVAKIRPRSSLSMRSIKTETGVVNSNYRGNISVVLDNLSNKRIEFSVGDRIAQVIFEKFHHLF